MKKRRFDLVILLTSWVWFSPILGSPAGAMDVGRWEVFELAMTTSNSYGNPYTEVTLSATFTGPSAETITVEGFWDGGDMWKLRMAPTEVGTWTYTTTSNDSNLDGQNGGFQCISSGGKGFIHVSPSRPYTFEYSDGTPWFHFGDTNWGAMFDQVGFETRFKPYVDLRTAQRFNLIMVFLVTSDGDSHNEGGDVFGSTWDDLNPGFFQWMDVRVAYANSKGMVIVIQPAWPNIMASFSPLQYRRYIRYLVARYAAYEVFWNVSGEYEESGLSNSQITEYGETFSDYDPYDHPRSTHTLSSSRAFGNEPWHSYIMQQIYGDQNQSIIDDRIFYKPVVNSEYGYLHGYEFPITHPYAYSNDHVRTKGWEIVLGGGFFQTGFTNTYYVSRGEWYLNDPNDNLVAEQLSYLHDFFTQKTQWWEMNPDNALASGSSNFVLAEQGSEYVVYMREGGATNLDLSDASGTLSVEWLNPRTGEYTIDTPVTGGTTIAFTAFDSNDWVLHIGGTAPDTTPPSSPQNLTATAVSESQIDLTWEPASDPESGIDHYNIYRDDFKVGESDPASYTDTGLLEGITYTYEISAVNGMGLESPRSQPASATTLADIISPAILSVTALSATQVDVVFSESVEEASAQDEANYGIDHGIELFAANLDPNLTTVHLMTSQHAEGLTYTITVNDVRDRASTPNTIAPNSTAQYQVILQLVVFNLNKTNYQTDELDVGNPYYVDRPYTISNIPTGYHGLLWIMTANDDKNSSTEDFLNFTVNQDVTAYVAYDHRASSLPFWITDHYVETGMGIEVTDGASPLQLWARDVTTREVVMGGNMATGASGAGSMYVVLLRGHGAAADTTPPLISQLDAADITETGATIQWSTDEPADSQVEYGPTAAYGSTTPLDSNMVMQHNVVLWGLLPQTMYHYRVRSADGAGNTTLSQDSTFETADPSDTAPPQISSLEISAISDMGAVIGWSTDEPADSKVEYGLAPGTYGWSAQDSSLTLSHALELMGLMPATQYHFRVRSQDAWSNASVSQDSFFVTKHELPGPPGRPEHYDD
jgi:hypothetical protein